MLKVKLTKYGSLILSKEIRENILLHEGDKFIPAIDTKEAEKITCIYFIRTNDDDGTLKIENKDGLFYMRLSRYLRNVGLQYPYNCHISIFENNGREGFKLDFVNIYT
jgi:hypothetical protein